MSISHRVRLSEDERATLIGVTRRGEASARRITRARVLLLADRGTTDRAIADALDVHPRTCQRLPAPASACANAPARRGWRPPSTIAHVPAPHGCSTSARKRT